MSRRLGRIRVCHINNLLPNYHKMWGGGAQATYRFVKLLVKNNVENVVLSTKPIKTPEKEKEGFEFHTVNLAQDILGEKIGKFLKRPFDPIAYFNTYRILKKIKPDILHIHNFGDLGFGVILAAKKLKIPVVFSIYNYWCFCPLQTLIKNDNSICTRFHGPQCIECVGNKDPLQKLFLSKRKNMFDFFLFNKVDKFLALSNFLSQLLQDYGVKKERIAVVRSPFKKIELKKSKIKKNSILYVGLFVPRKGLHVLVEAMPKILKEVPDAKLYVIGQEDPNEISYKIKVKELIEKYKLEKNVLLLEKMPKTQFEQFINQSEIIVIPEQWQNMSPLMIIECMMFNKGIVTSNIGGIPELIQERETGLLVDNPSSSEELAEKIVWALKNKKKMQEMGKNARKRALDFFDEKRIAKELLKVYNSLIKKGFVQ